MITRSPVRDSSVEHSTLIDICNPFSDQDTSHHITHHISPMPQVTQPQTQTHTVTNTEISATSVKLPTFWSDYSEAWFVHTEAQSAAKGIVIDSTKYEYLIISLPQEVIMTDLDVIQNPPSVNEYDFFKKGFDRTFFS